MTTDAIMTMTTTTTTTATDKLNNFLYVRYPRPRREATYVPGARPQRGREAADGAGRTASTYGVGREAAEDEEAGPEASASAAAAFLISPIEERSPRSCLKSVSRRSSKPSSSRCISEARLSK